MISRFAVAVLLSLSATTASAQTPEPRTSNVDVVVTDSRGNRIRGLSAADFEVVGASGARALTAVAEIAPGGAVEPSPRRILIFIDSSSLTLPRRRAAVDALKTWIGANFRPIDTGSVVVAGPLLQTKVDWTHDENAILAALDTASRESVGRHDQDRRRAEQVVYNVVEFARSLSPDSQIQPSFEEAMQAGRSYAAASMRETGVVLSALSNALTRFSMLPERKVMIIAGEGLPQNPGYDMFMYLNSLKMQIESIGPAILVPTARRASPLTEATQYNVTADLHQLTRTAAVRGVAVYAINPGQNEDTSGAVEHVRPQDMSTQFARATSGMSGYQYLARGTGGIAYSGREPKFALQQIQNDLDSYYTLSYAGEATGVTVKSKSGHRIRSTVSARTLTTDERMAESVVAHQLMVPATNDLQITLAADQVRDLGTDRVVPLRVLIPIAKLRLEPSGKEVTGAFTVYIASGNDKGGSTQVSKQTHQIRWPAEAVQLGQGKSMTYKVDVPLPPGYHQISVGVRDNTSEQTGFERLLLASSGS